MTTSKRQKLKTTRKRTRGLFARAVGVLLTFSFLSMLTVGTSAQDQSESLQALSIELYTSLRGNGRPESIALRLQKVIQRFRYRCLRVNEYQIYNRQPNMIELKVGCISTPPYGVSVAANGYLSIYGGNGMLEPINGEDGRVFIFNADGSLQPVMVPEFRQYLSRTAEKAKMGDDESKLYLLVLTVAMGLVVLAGAILWWRSWRRMRYSIAYNQYLPSDLKDQLISESTLLSENLYKHPMGFYIARGRRGKRRLFNRRFQAVLYRNFSFKFGEIAHLPNVGKEAADEDEDY